LKIDEIDENLDENGPEKRAPPGGIFTYLPSYHGTELQLLKRCVSCGAYRSYLKILRGCPIVEIMRRRFHCSSLLVASFIAAAGVSCASHDKRADSAHTQLITIADIIALNVRGSLSFKDRTAVQETLDTVNRTDTDSAVVLNKDGSVFGQYEKADARISSARLARFVQGQLPEPRSAYNDEIGAFVAVSPVNTADNTIGYVALALK
jgi:hypothetical protein